MKWWNDFRKNRQRKRLTDPAYETLFDDYEGEEYVVFDTETSSLDPTKAELLTIGAVKVRGRRILSGSRLHLLVRPEAAIDEASIKVHHLRHCDVAYGMAPEEAVKAFLEFAGNRPLVGYYLEFDVAMIDKYLKPMIGVGLPNEKIEISGLYYDKKIGRIPQGNIDLRFDTIMNDLQLPAMGKHSALNDAIMTAMIYVKLTA